VVEDGMKPLSSVSGVDDREVVVDLVVDLVVVVVLLVVVVDRLVVVVVRLVVVVEERVELLPGGSPLSSVRGPVVDGTLGTDGALEELDGDGTGLDGTTDDGEPGTRPGSSVRSASASTRGIEEPDASASVKLTPSSDLDTVKGGKSAGMVWIKLLPAASSIVNGLNDIAEEFPVAVTFPTPQSVIGMPVIGATVGFPSTAMLAAFEFAGPNISQIRFAMSIAWASLLKPPSVYVAPPIDSRIVLPYCSWHVLMSLPICGQSRSCVPANVPQESPVLAKLMTGVPPTPLVIWIRKDIGITSMSVLAQ
jgi:hypothetical protein